MRYKYRQGHKCFKVGTGNYRSTLEGWRIAYKEQGSWQMEVLVLGKVLVLGFLSCIGIGIVKNTFQVLVLVLGRSFGIGQLCILDLSSDLLYGVDRPANLSVLQVRGLTNRTNWACYRCTASEYEDILPPHWF